MKQKIIIVSHCLLNVASKVVMYEEKDMEAEEDLRKRFIKKAVDNGIQIIQMSCPEFTLYGPKRWGHVSEQFDNIFFRNHCKKILIPIINQILEYKNNPDRFEILGIVGIDGSPSCGVDYTCTGKSWYGCITGRDDKVMDIVHDVSLCKSEGILIQVLRESLMECGLTDIPITSLFAEEPNKCLDLVDE
ncbi:hypothetical protein SH1V18_42650 [Vallitalea longa]|uniref:DUF523 domain-containing protein n=1 Tax=Vallitalea longa TaxID=2936439 RepID=A0A9W6DGM2_9FIRM|nr:CD3072 family TudS-related putative desulfidase [Vallitalea longa]GKX31785.1 hypothetical protein SH1V18_42650 [Vallitalea longa]